MELNQVLLTVWKGIVSCFECVLMFADPLQGAGVLRGREPAAEVNIVVSGGDLTGSQGNAEGWRELQ